MFFRADSGTTVEGAASLTPSYMQSTAAFNRKRGGSGPGASAAAGSMTPTSGSEKKSSLNKSKSPSNENMVPNVRPPMGGKHR